MNDKPNIWFPAKRYGWGWGPPVCWQGWVVFGVWLIVWAGGLAWLLPMDRIGWVMVFTVVMVSVLVGICWWKGEKPRWRWGK